MKLVDTKDAVGTVLCHDITQIIKGVTKDARFRKGHVVKEEDIPVLLSLGKDHLYVWEAYRLQLPRHINDLFLCCYPLEKIIYMSGKLETICFMKMMQPGFFAICARMKV